MDVLKLNVNGEELNALRGARALLSRRGICVVMMHVFKAQYAVREELQVLWPSQAAHSARTAHKPGVQGRGGPVAHGAHAWDTAAAAAFQRVSDVATEMFMLLTREARMKLALYLEPPVVTLQHNEAVEIPLSSSDALVRIFAVPGTELQTTAAGLLTNTSAVKYASLPFNLENPNSQAYLVARAPWNVARCRRVAHAWLPRR